MNAARRAKYEKDTQKAANLKGIRNFGIVMDREQGGLSLRRIAANRGVSVGCVRKVLAKLIGS